MAHGGHRHDHLACERLESETLGGRPILDLGASLWEPDRYEAFCVCYQAMRRVDDLVDARRTDPAPITAAEKTAIRSEVLRLMLDDARAGDPCADRLREVRARFSIPRWPWERWTRSMLYDVDHRTFPTFWEYRRYAEGAAVAPGAIFLHFCGVRRTPAGYEPPAFDVRPPARPLAIFCYLVHIVRDVESDLRQNLVYFPDAVLARHGLTPRDLRGACDSGGMARLSGLLAEYHRWAGRYAREARRQLDAVSGLLDRPYRLSLELVFGLYHQVHEKIGSRGGLRACDFAPTEEEIRARIEAILGGWRVGGAGTLEPRALL